MIKFRTLGELVYEGYNETHLTDYLLSYRKDTRIPIFCSEDLSKMYVRIPDYLRYNGMTIRQGTPDLPYSKGKNAKDVLDDMAASFLDISSGFVTRHAKTGKVLKACQCEYPEIFNRLNSTDKFGVSNNMLSHISLFDLQEDLYKSVKRKTNKTYERQKDIYEYWAKKKGKFGMNFISQVLLHLDTAGYAFMDSFYKISSLYNVGDVCVKYVCSFDFQDELIERYGDDAEEYFTNIWKSEYNAKRLKLLWEE